MLKLDQRDRDGLMIPWTKKDARAFCKEINWKQESFSHVDLGLTTGQGYLIIDWTLRAPRHDQPYFRPFRIDETSYPHKLVRVGEDEPMDSELHARISEAWAKTPYGEAWARVEEWKKTPLGKACFGARDKQPGEVS